DSARSRSWRIRRDKLGGGAAMIMGVRAFASVPPGDAARARTINFHAYDLHGCVSSNGCVSRSPLFAGAGGSIGPGPALTFAAVISSVTLAGSRGGGRLGGVFLRSFESPDGRIV